MVSFQYGGGLTCERPAMAHERPHRLAALLFQPPAPVTRTRLDQQQPAPVHPIDGPPPTVGGGLAVVRDLDEDGLALPGQAQVKDVTEFHGIGDELGDGQTNLDQGTRPYYWCY
jgi:hypothetical protein